MKCNGSSLSLFLLVLLFSVLPSRAQVSFYQPSPSPCYGNFFIADFNGDGKPDMFCFGAVYFGNGDGTFTAGPSSLSTSVQAVADFNGDGKPDLLEISTGTLMVQLGNGDGTFQPAISTGAGAGITQLAAADLNGDGKADAVGLYNSSLYVYLGNGDGTFAAGVPYSLGSTPVSPTILFADFNGDHKTDILISYEGSSGPETQIVLLGNGDGTFQAAKSTASVYGSGGIAIGDFNGDGKLDLAVAGCLTSTLPCSAGTYLQIGNGDGTFQAPTLAFSVGGQMVAADFNGDGNLDLGVVGSVNDQIFAVGVLIYLGNGHGVFTDTNNYAAFAADDIQTADFNSDGKLDLVTGGTILLGGGDGTFRDILLPMVPDNPVAAAVGDFDKNGTIDLASVSSTNVDILSNDGTGTLTLIHTYALSASDASCGISTADLNGDGNLDLVLLGQPTGTGNWTYGVMLGNGDGSFQTPIFYTQTGGGNTMCVNPLIADFNKDQKPDLAIATDTQQLGILLGNGDGTFAVPAYVYDGPGYSTLQSADFNNDGNLDILASSNQMSGTQGAGILFGKGDGTFQAIVFPTTLMPIGAGIVADVNNDGKPDVVGSVQVALGNGDGTFTDLAPIAFTGSDVPTSVIQVGDLNGDGILDAITESCTGDALSLTCQAGAMLGNGDGTFGTLAYIFPAGVYPEGVSLFQTFPADMNGDGLADIVFADGVILNTTPKPAPDFALSAASGSATTQTVNAGQSASFSMQVTPTWTFSGTVNLSCAITPVVTPAPTCTLSTASLQVNGRSAQTFTVMVGTTATTTTAIVPGTMPPALTPRGPSLWTFAVLGAFLALALLLVRGRKRLPALALPAVVLVLAFGISCGGSGSSTTTHTNPGTPPGTYTATITATSGNLSHTMPLTVTVN